MRTWLGRFGVLSRFWRRFVEYAKVGLCLALIIFLFQIIAAGHGGFSAVSVSYSALFLVGIALAGAAGVAAAHEFRRPRESKEKREAWRKQLPW
jgi:hypothetical protein